MLVALAVRGKEALRAERARLCGHFVTSNHIHLLARDRGEGEVAQSMQLVAGRTAQEYNQRKGRQGAYWEDRYHATAVDTDHYLAQCMVYIDLNMVRAGVVAHPREWTESGYREIQHPPKRYRIIDMQALMGLFGVTSPEELQRAHGRWVDAVLGRGGSRREPYWSESVAVGSEEFVEGVKRGLGIKGRYRKASLADEIDGYSLHEPVVSYGPHSRREMGILSAENTVFWEQT